MRESNSALLTIATADEMDRLGRQLGAIVARSNVPLVITLGGELGAGKTTLVRGLLRALGIEGAIRSPTYTLIEPYESAGREMFHLDLYRVTSASEVEDLGVRDLLARDTVLLIEWPEKGEGALPVADLRIQISYSADRADQARSVAFVAPTEAGIGVLTHLDSVKHQERPLSS